MADLDRTSACWGLSDGFTVVSDQADFPDDEVVILKDRLKAIEEAYADRDGARLDHLDGLTVELPDGGWFNVRPSNTEPLLRLNVEAADTDAMARLRDDALAIIRG